ncbi:MAG: hypothetical protein ABSB60_17945 [Terracidiphilus sp.]|jgi:hypothetical protein
MTNLLDEGIDQHQTVNDMGTGCRVLFDTGQYQGIANTIVQLIRRSSSVVIAQSQPIPMDERPRNCASAYEESERLLNDRETRTNPSGGSNQEWGTFTVNRLWLDRFCAWADAAFAF